MSANNLNQVGHQQISGFSTAQSLTVVKQATHALISVATNSCRWRADGTAPTASIGILVASGGTIDFTDGASDFAGILSKFQIIPTTSTATIDIAYFRN